MNNKRKYLYILLKYLFVFYFLSSCGKVQKINHRPHQFTELVKRVIWIHVPGLSEEHLAMLRFYGEKSDKLTVLEKMTCFGKAWSYNLIDLRPKHHNSFFSQFTGSGNIKKLCQSKNINYIWNYLTFASEKLIILEDKVSDHESFESLISCNQKFKESLGPFTLIKMKKDDTKKAKFFHYLHESKLEGGVYYDLSCQKGACYTSLETNAKALFNKIKKYHKNYTFIVRFNSYFENLKKQEYLKAKDNLNQLMEVVKFFKKNEVEDNTLVLVSGAETIGLELPLIGKGWKNFFSRGKGIIYRRSKLVSPVFASGAMAENYCGIYRESELMERAFEKNKQPWAVDIFSRFTGGE